MSYIYLTDPAAHTMNEDLAKRFVGVYTGSHSLGYMGICCGLDLRACVVTIGPAARI